MNYQDRRGSLTAEELRQRYNLDGLQNDRRAIQLAKEGITKVENEQENIIKSIIISLDGLESQRDISLWFFDGVPSKENKPYTEWEEPSDHIGDLYYDRETGYVYQLSNELDWIQQFDDNLIQAMALTNSEIDVTDNERKVFFEQPAPPYSNGDWWLKQEGLYICQISKDVSQSFNENDFIIATQYVTGTQANQINDKITIVSGKVTTIEQGIDEINQEIEENKYYVDEDGNKHLISTGMSQMIQRVDSITSTVTNVQSDINTISQAIDTVQTTIMEQTESQFEMWFEQTGLQNQLNEIDGIVNSTNTDMQTLSQYIRFFEGQIELGRSDSEVKLVIKNDKISFMTGTNESAYISNNKLYITDSTILTRLQVGQFVDEVDESGNLNKRWIGD